MKLVPATEGFYEGDAHKDREAREPAHGLPAPSSTKWISSDDLERHSQQPSCHMAHVPRHRPRLPLSEPTVVSCYSLPPSGKL